MDGKDTEQQNNSQYQHREDGQDVEFAQEVTATDDTDVFSNTKDKTDAGQSGWGITAIVISALSFFVIPFVLSILGIVLGVISGTRGSTLGWWAVGIGAISFLIRLFVLPFAVIF